MTKHKHLKARVHARMEKTGESYASARRHIVIGRPEVPSPSPGYGLRGGVHPDTAAVANALANAGVGAAGAGPLSEAMILGIGGGLGAGYILWQFQGHHPIVTLGFRNQWQYPDRWLAKTCERLGIDLSLDHTSGPVRAMRSLRDALAGEGPRPLVWIDSQEIGYWHLPAQLSGHGGYPVIVYGEVDRRFLIDDRNSERLSVDDDTLRAARARVSSYRNRLAKLEAPPEISSDQLVAAVRRGLADQVEHLSSDSDSFSLPAWRKWSRMLVDARNKKGWRTAFRGQVGLFGALLSTYESIESSGYNGGSLRDLYARFLDEAAELLNVPGLASVADHCRGLGRLWGEVAETAAPRNREPFASARALIDSLHEHVLEEGDDGALAARSVGTRLWESRLRLQDESVIDDGEFDGFLQELSERLDAIEQGEREMVSRLAVTIDRR